MVYHALKRKNEEGKCTVGMLWHIFPTVRILSNKKKRSKLLTPAITCMKLKKQNSPYCMIPFIGNSRQAKLFYGRKRTMVVSEDKTVGIVWCRTWGKFLGVMFTFCISIGAWVHKCIHLSKAICAFVKTQNIHLRFAQFTIVHFAEKEKTEVHGKL